MKICSRCKENKTLDQFYVGKTVGGYCKSCVSSYQKERFKSNPDKARAVTISRYGITPEFYSKMFKNQGGVCAICKNPETKKNSSGTPWNLGVDHDHSCCPGRTSCGKCVRALLCHSCNNGIGCFNDNSEKMLDAVTYLMSFQNILYREEVNNNGSN